MRLGLSNREIGRRLDISHTTIGRYRLAEGSVGPWTSCAAPFSGEPSTGAPNAPPMNHHADQTPPPPQPVAFRQGYHDRTFKSFSALLGFEGWDLDRVRNAIALHDQGIFMESSLLTIVVTRFAPLFAALKQAVAPVLALPRKVDGGTRGLARLLRDEVEAQLAPRAGLMPSVYFPPTLWGSAAIDLRMMGFSVLQHVYGDPDPDTAVRPVYTRRWPTWATHYYRYRRTFVALTTDGPVDIVSGDGKFTLLADTEEPHFDGAIRALALEVLDGSLTKQARNSYIDRYGNPKWVGFMPPNTSVRSPEGDAMFDALETLQGPDGTGVLPSGADFKTAQMTSAQNSVFDSALENVWRHVAAALLGSDGTMSPSTGVYSAPIFAGVRRDLIDQVLKCMVRGVNMGHVAPFLSLNYAASIAEASGWVDPVLDIPLPDPEAEARMKAYKERALGLSEIVEKERKAGFVVTQERVDQIAYELGVAAPKLGPAAARGAKADVPDAEVAKTLTTNEIRETAGYEPLPDQRGERTSVEAAAKADASVEEAKADASADADIKVAEESAPEQPPEPPAAPAHTPEPPDKETP